MGGHIVLQGKLHFPLRKEGSQSSGEVENFSIWKGAWGLHGNLREVSCFSEEMVFERGGLPQGGGGCLKENTMPRENIHAPRKRYISGLFQKDLRSEMERGGHVERKRLVGNKRTQGWGFAS